MRSQDFDLVHRLAQSLILKGDSTFFPFQPRNRSYHGIPTDSAFTMASIASSENPSSKRDTPEAGNMSGHQKRPHPQLLLSWFILPPGRSLTLCDWASLMTWRRCFMIQLRVGGRRWSASKLGPSPLGKHVSYPGEEATSGTDGALGATTQTDRTLGATTRADGTLGALTLEDVTDAESCTSQSASKAPAVIPRPLRFGFRRRRRSRPFLVLKRKWDRRFRKRQQLEAYLA